MSFVRYMLQIASFKMKLQDEIARYSCNVQVANWKMQVVRFNLHDAISKMQVIRYNLQDVIYKMQFARSKL